MIPAILGGVIGLAGLAAQADAAKKQRRMAMRIQKEQWEREDTAVSRRMEDLKAAGLHPTLAGAQGAPAATPTAGMQAVEAKGREGVGAVISGMERAMQSQHFAQTWMDTAMKYEMLKRTRWENQYYAEPARVEAYRQEKDGTHVIELVERDFNRWIQKTMWDMDMHRGRRTLQSYEKLIKYEHGLQEELKTARMIVEREFDFRDMSGWEIDLIAKGIVVEMAKKNLKFYDVTRLPPPVMGALTGIAKMGFRAIPGVP